MQVVLEWWYAGFTRHVWYVTNILRIMWYHLGNTVSTTLANVVVIAISLAPYKDVYVVTHVNEKQI